MARAQTFYMKTSLVSGLACPRHVVWQVTSRIDRRHWQSTGIIVASIDVQADRGSKQAGARVLLEDFRVPDIAAQRFDRTVARLVHHLEDGGAALGGAREKPGAHRVPGEKRRIEPDALGIELHDVSDRLSLRDLES
jgi:hypothetical protein